MDALIETLGLRSDSSATLSEHRVVTATVARANADVAMLTFTSDGQQREGVMPVTEYLPGRSFTVGETLTVLLCDEGERPLLSMSRPELIGALLSGVSPEVRDGSVRIMGVARRAGVRTKVAVATTVPGVDPIAACVGRVHNRVDHVKAALLGEQVDIVAWHPDQDTFLRNALQPASVIDVTIDEQTHAAVATAPLHQMSAAVGNGGWNSALAGQLTGTQVRIEQA